MAKTNYKVCWWLIQAVNGEFGEGSFKDGKGYRLKDLYKMLHHNNLDALDDEDEKNKFRLNFIRWRAIIYNQFGLAILSESTPGQIRGKGEGGYYYYLQNGELLDEEGMKLRDLIKHLAECETDYYSRVSLEEMSQKYRGSTSSMGFISADQSSSLGYLSQSRTSYRQILGEENLELIQFAMQFGEVLTVKYGKVKAGIDINAPYSFEPYQLKEIEGRWYVIGNLYPLGKKNQAELAIYDLARLEFAYDENPDVLYEPVKEFDICEKIVTDEACGKLMDKLLRLRISAKTDDFADYISQHPLCSGQDEGHDGNYMLYTRMSKDLIIQFGAYGDEMSFKMEPFANRFEREDRDMIHNMLNLFRGSGKEPRQEQ